MADVFGNVGVRVVENEFLGIGVAVEDEYEVCCVVEGMGDEELQVDAREFGFVVGVGDERTLGGWSESFWVVFDERVAGWEGLGER